MSNKILTVKSEIVKIKGQEKGIENIFSFFEGKHQKQYASPFSKFGQSNKDSCVAASVKMLLNDADIQESESYIASALETRGGAYLSKVPQVLTIFGLKTNFVWKNDLTFEQLKESLQQNISIVSIIREDADFGHALVIDAIIDGDVRFRDPLPVGQGKSYAVSIEKFKEVWLRENNKGIGVVYDKQN